MSKIDRLTLQNLSEEEIDQKVESQADDDSAWETSIQVNHQPISLSIPGELAAQAKFLANLEQKANVETWLLELIQEQIKLKFTAIETSQRNQTRSHH